MTPSSVASCDFAQAFTTGNKDSGYGRHTIDARFQTDATGAAVPELTLPSRCVTGTKLADRIGPSSLTIADAASRNVGSSGKLTNSVPDITAFAAALSSREPLDQAGGCRSGRSSPAARVRAAPYKKIKPARKHHISRTTNAATGP